MDNQNSNKKRPFGRDDRGGSSFFRNRHKSSGGNDNQSEADSERTSYKKEVKEYKSSRPSYDRGQQSDKPSYGGSSRDDRGGERGERSSDRGDRGDRGGYGKPRFDKSDKPSYGRSDKPSYGRSDKPSYGGGSRDDRGGDRGGYGKPRFTKSDRPSWGGGSRDERGGDRSERSGYNKSRFDKSDRPSYGSRDGGRDDRGGDRGGYGKPRFDKSDKPSYGSRDGGRDDRGGDRGGYRPRSDRFSKEGDKSAYGNRDRKPRDRKDSTPAMPEEVRLNRYIAMSGVCSRREADQLIEAGEVTVNGVVVVQLGSKVSTSTDEIRMNGELLKGEKKVYIILNKPKGYVTTVEDPHADRTVMDLLKGECPERIYPVGRLDKNTTGVLLLTNDGNLTKELTHPSFNKKKIYHVFLEKPCTEADLEKITTGIELEDGKIHADEASFVEGNESEVGIEMHSGRNRIVRRMFESLGYNVVKLDRVYFAGLTKMGLRRGFWRHLTAREVSALKSGSYE